MATTNTAGGDFRCYVADLAAYNSGRLIGEWLTLDGLSADEIRAEVAAVIARSPFPGAEEYAIHDWDGISATFGEWPDWEQVAAYVAAMEELGDDESDREAFAAYCDNIGEPVTPETLDSFRDAYCGCYRDGAEYAEDLAEELGAVPDPAPWPLSCIDWDAAWRELELGGDNWAHRGECGLHVYRSC
jgi:antirestriction protein